MDALKYLMSNALSKAKRILTPRSQKTAEVAAGGSKRSKQLFGKPGGAH
jgi:hypothetical protein